MRVVRVCTRAAARVQHCVERDMALLHTLYPAWLESNLPPLKNPMAEPVLVAPFGRF